MAKGTPSNVTQIAATVGATYPAPTCGGNDISHDELYRFVPSQSAQVRISARYPSTQPQTVIALYDGTNGMPPLTRAQLATTTTAIDQSHETQSNAMRVPVDAGGSYVDNGSTSGMTSDVSSTYYQEGGLQCGAITALLDANHACL